MPKTQPAKATAGQARPKAPESGRSQVMIKGYNTALELAQPQRSFQLRHPATANLMLRACETNATSGGNSFGSTARASGASTCSSSQPRSGTLPQATRPPQLQQHLWRWLLTAIPIWSLNPNPNPSGSEKIITSIPYPITSTAAASTPASQLLTTTQEKSRELICGQPEGPAPTALRAPEMIIATLMMGMI